jgi:hypothetical protein
MERVIGQTETFTESYRKVCRRQKSQMNANANCERGLGESRELEIKASSRNPTDGHDNILEDSSMGLSRTYGQEFTYLCTYSR